MSTKDVFLNVSCEEANSIVYLALSGGGLAVFN